MSIQDAAEIARSINRQLLLQQDELQKERDEARRIATILHDSLVSLELLDSERFPLPWKQNDSN